MGKFKGVISEARKPAKQKTRSTESQISGSTAKQESSEPPVNLTIKVPGELRRHWAAEAKREGTTLTAVITQALRDRFGEP